MSLYVMFLYKTCQITVLSIHLVSVHLHLEIDCLPMSYDHYDSCNFVCPGAVEISDAPSSGQTHSLHHGVKLLNVSSTEIDCKISTELEALGDETCVGTAEIHNPWV